MPPTPPPSLVTSNIEMPIEKTIRVLFFGKKGSGKTEFIKTLSNYLSKDQMIKEIYNSN